MKRDPINNRDLAGAFCSGLFWVGCLYGTQVSYLPLALLALLYHAPFYLFGLILAIILLQKSSFRAVKFFLRRRKVRYANLLALAGLFLSLLLLRRADQTLVAILINTLSFFFALVVFEYVSADRERSGGNR